MLKLTDLNDYIAPSTACIKPKSIGSNLKSSSELKVEREDDPDRLMEKQQLQVATITLNDCLACSGCITSSESVLISMQSKEQFYSQYQNALSNSQSSPFLLVVGVSPQTRAVFSAKYGISSVQVMRLFSWFFKRFLPESIRVSSPTMSALNVETLVFDTCLARDISLTELANDFVSRYQKNPSNLPLMTSACPGWICYAEKTHGDWVLPFISTAKSPQQVMGSLVKSYLARKLDLNPTQIYHLSVMPCFDKKLEASRADFYSEIYSCRDVDCVLSSMEVEQMLVEANLIVTSDAGIKMINPGYSIKWESEPVDIELSNIIQNENGDYSILATKGSSSGGYLQFVMEYALDKLCDGAKIDDDSRVKCSVKQGRNQDWIEYRISVRSTETESEWLEKFSFVQAYGFRNIQNVIRQLNKQQQRSSLSNSKQQQFCHFIEVMACPTGCINGGGQLKPDNPTSTGTVPPQLVKQFISKANQIYQQGGDDESGKDQIVWQSPTENQKLPQIYAEWFGDDQDDVAQTVLHTAYHNVKLTDLMDGGNQSQSEPSDMTSLQW